VRAALPKVGKHALNDLAIAANGDVYATDSLDSGVYRLRAGAKTLEAFVPPGVFRSPQGIAFAADGRGAYVADYVDGIWLVDLATGKREAVTGPRDVPLQGVDALAIHGKDLVVSQNGIVPARIARLALDASGRRVESGEILEMNTPLVEEPTLGVVVGDDFIYVANAQWERLDNDGKLNSEFTEPTIARVALPRR
jgi:sugar lactone lactonase YvrE